MSVDNTVPACVQFIDDLRTKRCDSPATKQDLHGRSLCNQHYDMWLRRSHRGQIRASEISYKKIVPVKELVRYIETNTGTVEDILRCVNGCRSLIQIFDEVHKHTNNEKS